MNTPTTTQGPIRIAVGRKINEEPLNIAIARTEPTIEELDTAAHLLEFFTQLYLDRAAENTVTSEVNARMGYWLANAQNKQRKAFEEASGRSWWYRTETARNVREVETQVNQLYPEVQEYGYWRVDEWEVM